MMSRLSFIAIILLVSAIALHAQPPLNGTIYGIVADSITGLPLENAFVRAIFFDIPVFYDTTDASGSYAFTELTVEPHDIEASKEGYVTKVREDVQPAPEPGTEVNFFLLPEGIPHCNYILGDVNGNGAVNGIDVVYAVSYFKGGNAPHVDCNPPCIYYGNPPRPLTDPYFAAGDVNGDCFFNGLDIIFYVGYLAFIQPHLRPCPYCPPMEN